MRIEITKSKVAADLVALRDEHLPNFNSKLVYDDEVDPIIDTITPYTNALAALATTVNPDIKYPGQPK